MTTYRNLAEIVVDYLVRKMQLDDAECLTRTVPLPGASGISSTRRMLSRLPGLSEQGRQRLVEVYGGRAAAIADLAFASPDQAATLDSGRRVLAAEVGFVIEEEFATTLIDIVHRRMMIGLAPDQGVTMTKRIAELAALRLNWDRRETARQVKALQDYNARLSPTMGFQDTP